MNRFSSLLRSAAPLAAGLCAAGIFLADNRLDLHAAVSVAYLFVIMIGAYGRGPRAIYGWTAVCLAMAILSCALAYGPRLDLVELLRLVFSCLAICVTGALLLSRHWLQKARLELAASEANMSNFANSVPQILWRGYPDGSCDYINRRLEELTGYVFEPGRREKDWPLTVHPDDRDKYLGVMMEAFAAGRDFRVQFRMMSADGGYREAITIGRPAPDPRDPSKTAYYGGISDVHDEFEAQSEVTRLNEILARRIEEQTGDLRRSESRFRTLFSDLNIAFAEQDISVAKRMLDEAKAAGATNFRALAEQDPAFVEKCAAAITTVNVNDALLHLLGYSAAEDLLATPHGASFEGSRQIMMLQLEAMFDGRKHFSGFTTLVGKDERRVPVAFGVNMLEDWSVSLSTHIDVTEQHRAHELMLNAQDQLARAGRAATMGALSTSLAHELNQPILAMGVDTQTCRRWLEREDPEIEQALRVVERLGRNVDRVAAIVRHTRDQLVNGRRSLVPVDLCAMIRETHGLLERDLLTRRSTLIIDCPCEPIFVLADPVEMQQVLVNLIVNAADAMVDIPGRREVTVQIRADQAGAATVIVSDTGPGIAEENLPQLFDPFFTTKPGGIGMGLQICRSIIDAFGGNLSAANQPQGGAVFTFRLPAPEDPSLDEPDDEPGLQRAAG